MSEERFLDKKKWPKKKILYPQIVPVDIHRLIHSQNAQKVGVNIIISDASSG